MTGYQEVVTDPSFCGQIVCFTAPMVGNYGVAERARESRARARARRRDARGARAGVDGLAARARHRRAHRRRHALARPPPARARRAARRARRGRRRGRRSRSPRSRAQPSMAGRALVAGVSTTRAVRLRRRGRRRASRSSTTAASARSCAGSPRRARRSTVFPHDVDADTLAGYDGVVLSNGPGDPEPLDGRDGDGARAARPRAGARHLPRPPAARARDRPRDLQAPVRPSRREPSRARARDRPRARHEPEPRLRGRAPSDAPEATHESLYDGTVEGLAYPELRARSVQFHPEAGPGPHDALADPRDWVEEVTPCRGVTTSSRSA